MGFIFIEPYKRIDFDGFRFWVVAVFVNLVKLKIAALAEKIPICVLPLNLSASGVKGRWLKGIDIIRFNKFDFVHSPLNEDVLILSNNFNIYKETIPPFFLTCLPMLIERSRNVGRKGERKEVLKKIEEYPTSNYEFPNKKEN